MAELVPCWSIAVSIDRRSSLFNSYDDNWYITRIGSGTVSIFTTAVGLLIRSFGVQYHQYADDTQLYTAITSALDSILNLFACADAVTTWHIQNDLLLNPTKTEALMTGTRQQVIKIYLSAGIMVTGANVPFVNKIRVLRVTIDSELYFDDHIASVVRTCNFHIRAMRYIRHLLNQDAANTIVCSIVCSRQDYCNTVLYGVTAHNISRLQRVQISLARVVCGASYRSSATNLRRRYTGCRSQNGLHIRSR